MIYFLLLPFALFSMDQNVPDDESSVVYNKSGHDKSLSHETDYLGGEEEVLRHISADSTGTDYAADETMPGYVPENPVILLNKKFKKKRNVVYRVYASEDLIADWAQQFAHFFDKPGGYLFLLICRDQARISGVMNTFNNMGFDLAYKNLFFYRDVENMLMRVLLEKNKLFHNKDIQYELKVAFKKYFSFLLHEKIEVDENGPLEMIYDVLKNPISLDELFTERRQDYCIAIGFLLIILNELVMCDNLYRALERALE